MGFSSPKPTILFTHHSMSGSEDPEIPGIKPQTSATYLPISIATTIAFSPIWMDSCYIPSLTVGLSAHPTLSHPKEHPAQLIDPQPASEWLETRFTSWHTHAVALTL